MKGWGVLTHIIVKWVSSSFLSHFFLSLFLVMGENTNRHRDLLDRFERPGRWKHLGVEWREAFYRIFIVCIPLLHVLKPKWMNEYTLIIPEGNSQRQGSRFYLRSCQENTVPASSGSGCRASLITLMVWSTAARWSDTTLDTGTMTTAATRGNISANTSMVRKLKCHFYLIYLKIIYKSFNYISGAMFCNSFYLITRFVMFDLDPVFDEYL